MKKIILYGLLSLSLFSQEVKKKEGERYSIKYEVPNSRYERVNKFLNEKIKAEEAEVIKIAKDTPDRFKYILDGKFISYENEWDIDSNVYEMNIFTGGAHGRTKHYFYNVYNGNGNNMTLTGLLKPEGIEFLISDIKKQISESKDPYKFFKNPVINLDKTYYYFEGEDLVIAFPHYVIGPNSSGIIKFSYSKDELQKYMW